MYAQQVNTHEAIICVLASQIANLGESIIGASLQEKEGFGWVGSLKNSSNFHILIDSYKLMTDY